MLNRKLLEILKRLEPVEIKRLRQFLHSPYFTYGFSNQEIIKLFEHIVRHGANEHLPELEKKQVNALLFPDKLYNENGKSPIDTLTTDLLRLTKKFLFIQWAENDTSEAMKELPVARFYRKFGLEERFWKSVEHMRSLFDENLYHDEFYFLDRYFVEEEVSTFKALFNSSEDDLNIGAKAMFLENFFSIARMNIACELKYQRQMFELNQIYYSALDDELANLIRQGVLPDNDVALNYVLVYEIIHKPQDFELIEQIKERLEAQKNILPPPHLKNFMAYLRIFIMRRYQQSDRSDYLSTYFELISQHLEEGYLYYDGKVLATSLRNITYNGLKLGAYERVRAILENHPPERIGGTRYPKEIYNLLLSIYHFELKNYETAEKYLIITNFDNLQFYIQAEILQIKIYYETNSDLLDSRLKALQQKVRRSKMSKELKERYFTLFNKILLLVKYGWDKKGPKHAKLIDEIRNKPGLLEKEWLLKQLQ
jgi:hypothetical protein